MPGVSIMTQAPKGCISMALYTGSVVVPATSDTMEVFCPVRRFIRDDLPLFVLPKIPMWSLLAFGVEFNSAILKPKIPLTFTYFG